MGHTCRTKLFCDRNVYYDIINKLSKNYDVRGMWPILILTKYAEKPAKMCEKWGVFKFMARLKCQG